MLRYGSVQLTTSFYYVLLHAVGLTAVPTTCIVCIIGSPHLAVFATLENRFVRLVRSVGCGVVGTSIVANFLARRRFRICTWCLATHRLRSLCNDICDWSIQGRYIQAYLLSDHHARTHQDKQYILCRLARFSGYTLVCTCGPFSTSYLITICYTLHYVGNTMYSPKTRRLLTLSFFQLVRLRV